MKNAGKLVFVFAILALTRVVAAHEGADDDVPHSYGELWRTWAWEPGTVIPLVLGLWRIWRAAGYGHGIKPWHAWCFALGWLSLVLALISPLHPWGQVLFWPHMRSEEHTSELQSRSDL